jgi:hypothetical protein
MFFYVTTAKGKRIDRAKQAREFLPYKERTINKGDKVLVFSNGTHGKGSRSYNYSKEEALKMLKDLIKKLSE